MDYSEVNQLKGRAFTLKTGLFERLEEYYTLDFPSKQPHRLIELLQDILERLDREIENTTNRQTLFSICFLIESYGQLLEFIDNAHTEQTPRGLVLILDNLIEKLSSKAYLIVRPQSKHNYSIINLLAALKTATEGLFSKSTQLELYNSFEPDLKIISFPRIQRDNMLVHAVFGHELGHPIADDYLVKEELDDSFKNELREMSDEIDIEYEGLLEKAQSKLEKIDIKQKILSEILKIRTRALEELISDSVSALIFGPSAIFASYELLINPDIDDSPLSGDEYYPPTRMRLRVQNDLLKQIGCMEALRATPIEKVGKESKDSLVSFLDHIDSLATLTTDWDSIQQHSATKIAYKNIESAIYKSTTYVRSRVGQLEFRVDDIKTQIPELIQRLIIGLPPNEIGHHPKTTVVDWRISLLSAWIFKIGGFQFKGGPETKNEISMIKQLQKLTLLSIEYIFVQNSYRTFIETS